MFLLYCYMHTTRKGTLVNDLSSSMLVPYRADSFEMCAITVCSKTIVLQEWGLAFLNQLMSYLECAHGGLPSVFHRYILLDPKYPSS